MWLNLTTQNKRFAEVVNQPIITVNKQIAEVMRRYYGGIAEVLRRFPPPYPPLTTSVVC